MGCFQDMGTILIGKVESGIVSKNETILLMPNRVSTLFFHSTHVYGPQDKSVQLKIIIPLAN